MQTYFMKSVNFKQRIPDHHYALKALHIRKTFRSGQVIANDSINLFVKKMKFMPLLIKMELVRMLPYLDYLLLIQEKLIYTTVEITLNQQREATKHVIEMPATTFFVNWQLFSPWKFQRRAVLQDQNICNSVIADFHFVDLKKTFFESKQTIAFLKNTRFFTMIQIKKPKF